MYSLKIAIFATVVWFAIWVSISLGGLVLYDYKYSLNEVGDFLAGVSSPVAFFWLVLGYFQQSRELRQNTKALEQQREALELQVEELRLSVEAQTRMVDVTERQFMHEKERVIRDNQPDISLMEKSNVSEGGGTSYVLRLENRSDNQCNDWSITLASEVGLPIELRPKVPHDSHLRKGDQKDVTLHVGLMGHAMFELYFDYQDKDGLVMRIKFIGRFLPNGSLRFRRVGPTLQDEGSPR